MPFPGWSCKVLRKIGHEHGASLTGRVPLHSLCMLSDARACVQPVGETYTKGKTPLIWLYGPPRNALLFSKRFILSDVWDDLTRCSYSRQRVSNCALEISYSFEIAVKSMTTKLDSLLNICSSCKLSLSLFSLKGNCKIAGLLSWSRKS